MTQCVSTTQNVETYCREILKRKINILPVKKEKHTLYDRFLKRGTEVVEDKSISLKSFSRHSVGTKVVNTLCS